MENLRLRDLDLYITDIVNVKIVRPYRNPSGELDYVDVYYGSFGSLSDDLRESFISNIQPGFYDVMSLCIYLKER